jgi:hypothetical protein
MAFSTEIRENRAFAAEIKFFVPAGRIDALRSWARTRLAPDPFGGGPHGDTYETNSLYFDTPDFDVYHRRGSYGRSKYRVRRYGASAELFFERKLKTHDLVSKRRSIVPASDLPRLADPYPAKGWPGHWFHRRILARNLDLACQVAYTRTALVHTNGQGPIRLTLDEHVRAAPSRAWEPASKRTSPLFVVQLPERSAANGTQLYLTQFSDSPALNGAPPVAAQLPDPPAPNGARPRSTRAIRQSRPTFQDLSGAVLVTDGSAILELKYYRALPALFQQLIAEFSLVAQPISKYRLSVAALQLAQAANPQEVTL